MLKKAAFSFQKLPKAVWWCTGLAASVFLAALLVYYWRVFYYLDTRGVSGVRLTLAAAALAAGLYAAVTLTVRVTADFDRRCAVVILLCGLLFVFFDPPLQMPDEWLHYLRTYSISQGHFDFDAAREYPASVGRLIEAFPSAWVNGHTSAGVVKTQDGGETVYSSADYALKQQGENGPVTGIADGFAAYAAAEKADTAAASVTEPTSFMLIPYLLPALFMAVVRLCGAGALGCLYAGRIANLLLYTALCFAALKNCRRYKPAFLAVMLLPLGLCLGASLNYDALLLGCYYYVAGFYCRDEIQDRDLLSFAAVFLVMNAVKPWINLLWIVLPLVLPRFAWKAKCKKVYFAVLTLAAALAATFLVEWYGNAFRLNYPEIGRMLGDEVVSGGAQLAFVLRNPLRYIAVAVGTLYENDLFLGRLGVFGAMDLPIPLLNMLCPAALAFGAALSAHEKAALRPRAAAGLFGLSAVYAAGVITALYLTFTPVGMVRVLGLQARYFLPVFLLLTVLAAALLSRVLEPSDGRRGERALGTALGTFGALGLLGAVLLFQHYFIGPVFTIG